jgi:hypothetical protein
MVFNPIIAHPALRKDSNIRLGRPVPRMDAGTTHGRKDGEV